LLEAAVENMQIRDVGERRDVAASGSPLPAVDVPATCPDCGALLDQTLLSRQLYVCACGRHFRMHAGAWIALLASTGTWHECWTDLRPVDHLGWQKPRPYRALVETAEQAGLNEAVRTGSCQIEGHSVWLAAFDFRFMGGSLGLVSGERLARGLEQAAQLRTPYVLVAASGGARMQEGALALMQMAKVNAALARLKRHSVPYFSILTDPTFGGVAASLAFLGDVNIAEDGASIGFTGARVIRQATHATLHDGFQKAEFQLAHGQVDIVAPRSELRRTVVDLLDLFA
jgi:acetyl-CoA carboxylase carboxyl transferase subunit beta